ncbi:MAG TPA: DUF2807 domain-containing protein, partial [Flavobacterium sp.]|nr:DUF2807 domain-containing protein [Flavobacterium sp.]
FSKIKIEDGLNVEIVKAANSSILISGKEKDVRHVKADVEEGVLTVSREQTPEPKFCIFCFDNERVKITLNVASQVDSVEAERGSYFSGTIPSLKTLNLIIETGSGAKVTVEAEDFTAHLSNNSRLSLKGAAEKAQITLEDRSNFQGTEFLISNAKVTASNGSYADVSVEETLEAIAKNGSSVIYLGNPTLTETELNGSWISSWKNRTY